jgi:molybdopterin synthase catalytic subunit
MKVKVKLFAGARELADRAEIELELAAGDKVASLRAALAGAVPQLEPLVKRSMVAVNSEYASDDVGLRESDEVALIPPVSGG